MGQQGSEGKCNQGGQVTSCFGWKASRDARGRWMGTFNDRHESSFLSFFVADKFSQNHNSLFVISNNFVFTLHHLFPPLSVCHYHIPMNTSIFPFKFPLQNHAVDIYSHLLSHPRLPFFPRLGGYELKPHTHRHRKPQEPTQTHKHNSTHAHTHTLPTHSDKQRKRLLTDWVTVKCPSLYLSVVGQDMIGEPLLTVRY